MFAEALWERWNAAIPTEAAPPSEEHGRPFKPEPQSSLVFALQSEITEKDRRIAELAVEKNRLLDRMMKNHTQSMVAHRWFAKHFGEKMNGRDFDVKCEMADEELQKAKAELAEANRKLELMPALEAVSGETSDGYHTFNELYEHRITLWIALCKQTSTNVDPDSGAVWRSKLHSDGTAFDGWFILGMGYRQGCQMTYHLPDSKWKDTAFARTLQRAPRFDGHTSSDVLERIKRIL
jgi:hypothetical protein